MPFIARAPVLAVVFVAGVAAVIWGMGATEPAFPPEEGLALAAAPPLGRLAPRATRSISLAWRFEGPRPVRVLAMDTTCACATLTGLPAMLRPGAAGTLTLRVRAPARVGPFRTRVRILLDVPAPDDVLERIFEGFVEAAFVLRPDRIVLHRQYAGDEVVRRITVRDADALGDSLRKQMTCRLVGLPGHARPDAATDGDPRGVTVHVRLRMPEQAGTLAAAVEVFHPRVGWRRIPITGEVVVGSSRPRSHAASRPQDHDGEGRAHIPRTGDPLR